MVGNIRDSSNIDGLEDQGSNELMLKLKGQINPEIDDSEKTNLLQELKIFHIASQWLNVIMGVLSSQNTTWIPEIRYRSAKCFIQTSWNQGVLFSIIQRKIKKRKVDKGFMLSNHQTEENMV